MNDISSNRYEVEKGKIAILLATYNGERYLRELLESLIGQSLQNFCCFVHDDGSKDGTVKILEDYCSQYPKRFVMVEGESTGGAKSNFMYLMNQVRADYYMFCDQDDVWLPEKVKLSYNLIKKQEMSVPTVVYTDLKIVNSELSLIDSSYYHYTGKNPSRNSLIDLLKCNVTVGCTMTINRVLRDTALQVSNLDNIFMHDWWISLIASVSGQLIFLNEQTILYRQHGDNSVGAIKKKKFIEKVVQYINYREMIKKKKYYIKRPILFCRELSKVVNQECEIKKFIEEYASIDKCSKFQRIKFYERWNLFLDNSCQMWQMFWV
nr:glycosyltransferase family 2 protein [uncultured Blautia sp.]